MDGHSPTNALGKNNGIEAQAATVPLQQAYTDRDPDSFNDLGLDDPQADSSLCEYPEPGYGSLEQCIPEYSLSKSEQVLSSSGTCKSKNYFIPLNSTHQTVAVQHQQVMILWALIAMDSPFSVIIL